MINSLIVCVSADVERFIFRSKQIMFSIESNYKNL